MNATPSERGDCKRGIPTKWSWNAENYREIFHAINEAVFVHDAETGAIVDFNESMLHLFGIAREQVPGLSISVLSLGLSPYSEVEAQQWMARAAKGEPQLFEWYARKWKGDLFWVEVALRPAVIGGRNRVVATVRDISKRKRAEEQAMKQGAFSRSVIELAAEGLCVCHQVSQPPHLEFTVWNQRMAQISGYTMDEINRLGWYQAMYPDPEYQERAKARMNEMRQGKNLVAEEWEITRSDGQRRTLAISTTVLHGEEGDAHVLGLMNDVTERRRAEEARHESERNFRAFFESMTDIVVVASVEGRILFTNAAAHQKLGYTAAEFSGMHLLEWHPPNWRAEAKVVLGQIIRGERTNCSLPLITRDGTVIPAETKAWLGKWNGTICVYGICKDLTAEQEAHQRFERLFRYNPSAMALTTIPERRFADVNAAFEAVTGYMREEIVGRTSAEVQLFVQDAAHDAVAQRLIADGRMTNQPLSIQRRDGSVVDGLFSGEKIRSQGQEYLLTVMIDVTEQKRVACALKNSVSKLRATLEATADGILVVDLEGRIVDYNDQFVKLWKCPEEVINLGRRGDLVALAAVERIVQRFFGQLKDPAGFAARIQTLYEGPEENSFDVLEFVDGRTMERYSTPQRIEGKPIGRVWSFRDVTERNRTLAALQESQSRLRLFFNQSLDGFYFSMFDEAQDWKGNPNQDAVLEYADTHQRVTEVNDAMLEQYGATREHMVGRPIAEFFRHDVSLGRRLRRVLFEQGRLRVETRESRIDGTSFWAEGDYVCIYDERGKIAGTFGIQRDVTERKRAIEALQQSEEKFRRVVTAMAEGVILYQPNGSVLDCNQQAETILGQTRQEILDSNMSNTGWAARRMDGSNFQSNDHPALTSFRTGQGCTNVVVGIRQSDDSLRWVNINAEPMLRVAEATPFAVVCTFSDVTDRVQEARKLQELFVQIEKDAQTKGQLLHEVNHRVTNNLCSVLGLLMQESECIRVEDKVAVTPVLDRLQQRIRGLLLVHRLLAQTFWTPVRINQLAEQVIRGVVGVAVGYDQAQVAVQPSTQVVSPRQAGSLAMILNELATNSLKHASRSGTQLEIHLSFADEEKWISIFYEDNGPGFAKDVLENRRSNVGIKLIRELVTTTLRGTLSLTNSGGARVVVRVRREEEKRT